MHSSNDSRRKWGILLKNKIPTAIVPLLFLLPFSQAVFAQDIVSGSSVIVLKVRAAATTKTAPGKPAPRSKKAVPAKSGQAKTKNQPAVASKTGKPPAANPAIRTVSAGIINARSANLPKPVYPAAARMVKADGTVNVSVLVDENGDVVSAEAVSGHALLRAAAVNAALESRFEPVTLDGKPVRVRGIIVYNFSQ